MASFSTDNFNEIVRKKVALVGELREAEDVRGAIVGGLGDELDVGNLEFTISYLIEVLDEPYAVRLRSCANSLSSVVMEVSEFNKDNGILIERSLKYINDSLNILSGLVQERHTYSPSPNYMPSQAGFGRVFSTEA